MKDLKHYLATAGRAVSVDDCIEGTGSVRSIVKPALAEFVKSGEAVQTGQGDDAKYTLAE